jgi:hypothetical protein
MLKPNVSEPTRSKCTAAAKAGQTGPFGRLSWRTGFIILCATACQQASSNRCIQTTDCASTEVCRLGECRPLETSLPDGGKPSTDGGQNGTERDGGMLALCAATGACLLGEKCDKSSDCKSQFCASGVCCNEQCSGTCAACNLAGSAGTCKPAVKGTQCGAYVCDGTSLSCPSTCAKAQDCSPAYTCCQPGRSTQETDCVARGLTSSCFQLPACTAFQDNFDAPQLDTLKWGKFASRDGGTVDTSDGGIRIVLGYDQNTMSPYTGVYLKKRVSLVGNSCQIDVLDTAALEGAPAFAAAGFVLSDFGTGDLELRIDNEGRVAAKEALIGKEIPIVYSSPLPAQSRRILRLSEDAGFVNFDYSTDGKSFTRIDSRRTQIRTSDLFLQLSVYESTVQRDAGAFVTMDNFNAP